MSARPAQFLGRYEVIREIARSNDIVFEGWDPQTQRRVAIKTLHIPHGATEAQRADRIARFNREARATARLRHPNIVTLYDFGDEDGQPYLVFEYIDGPTLADLLLQKGPLSAPLATEYSIQLLSALEYSHTKSVIHRDIKPSNLFICEGDKVMVADLGIARIESEASVTSDGQVFGTPAYMAPEQVRGKDFDKRVDIWSCGVVLFQAVTGVQPFQGGSVLEIGSNVLNKEPNFDLISDARIRRVVRQALQKDPTYRYPTAAAMMRGLCSASPVVVAATAPAASVPIPATPIGQPTVAMQPVTAKARFWRSWLLWGATCVAAAAIGAGAVAWRMQPPSSPIPDKSVQTAAPEVKVTPKSLDDLVSEASEMDSLHQLVTAPEFLRLPEGAQRDQLDSWARQAMAKDYLGMSTAWRNLFLGTLMERFGNVSTGFQDMREASVNPQNQPDGISRRPEVQTARVFDIGSSEEVVEQVMGRPDAVYLRPGMKEYHYGASIVMIRSGRVVDYEDTGNLRVPIKIADNFIAPPPARTSTLTTQPSKASPQPVVEQPREEPPPLQNPDLGSAPPSEVTPASPPARRIYPEQRSTDLNDAEVLNRLGFKYEKVRVLPGGEREYSDANGSTVLIK